ncbi:hypothetical protein M5K25_000237 [Dendrobium thyrsiflorum]|uniref:Uncharacterized protein n=1 Tax=Dendrobium thyrsiflorum TaxID=117978 RepID=A0ABD0VTC7_DENTH
MDAGGLHDLLMRAGEALSIAFPLWVSLACLVALWKSPSFLWVGRTWHIVRLTLKMLGNAIIRVLCKEVLKVSIILCCWFDSYGLLHHFPAFLKSTASINLAKTCTITHLLELGNVALSVLMTAGSTFAAAIMTPFLTSKLAGQFVAVDPADLFISTVQIVLFPVLLGAILNQYWNNLVKFVSPVMPFIVVATVAILCGSAIAQSASAILSSGLQVVIAAIPLHGSGFFFSYVLSKLLGIGYISTRTVSIEVGMQHFGNPLTAVPCAVSSICQSIYGSVLAAIWRSMPVETKVED